MMSNLHVALCFVFALVATVSARPQVWNIGFQPNAAQNPFLPNQNGPQSLPQIDQNTISTTAAPAARVTTPSAAYYDCLSRCPTTSEYNPICGSDAVNYHNLGRLQCAARCGMNVSAVRGGTCMGL